MTVALGTALVLCNLGTIGAAAHARKAKVVREPRPIIRVPMVRTDRVDPYGPPVMPVIRYGHQEVYTAVDLARDVDFAAAILASRK